MKAEITRDVISDLWPLYRAGEASAPTRRLVEAYLAEDGDFKAVLEASEAIQGGLPEVGLAPDVDLRMIELSRLRIRTTAWLVGAAIGAFIFVSMAFLAGALYFALSQS